MFINGNDKVGEAKVYHSQRELELEKELEKYKQAYEKAKKTLNFYENAHYIWENNVTYFEVDQGEQATQTLKDCEAIIGDK